MVPRIGPYPTTDQIIIFIELWLLGFCIRFVMIPNDLELFVIVFSTIINNDSHSYSRLVRHMSYNPIVIQPPFSIGVVVTGNPNMNDTTRPERGNLELNPEICLIYNIFGWFYDIFGCCFTFYMMVVRCGGRTWLVIRFKLWLKDDINVKLYQDY